MTKGRQVASWPGAPSGDERMWMRTETDWQRDPYIQSLDGCARHLLHTIWCIAVEHGEATFDDEGNPQDVKVSPQFLSPAFLANESGLPVDVVSKAVDELLKSRPKSEWSPEIPARLVIDAGHAVVVRNVGRFQAKLFQDRERMRRKRAPSSLNDDGRSPRMFDGRKASSDLPGNGTVRNGTKQTTGPSALSAVKVLVDAFHSEYLKLTGSKPTWGAKQAGMVKTLLAKHSAEECHRRMALFFGPKHPKWMSYDLGTFVQHFDKLVEVGKMVEYSNRYREKRG